MRVSSRGRLAHLDGDGRQLNQKTTEQDVRTWLRDEEAKTAIERIMRRAPRVPQRATNSGRERAAKVTRSAGQTQKRKTFGLVREPQITS